MTALFFIGIGISALLSGLLLLKEGKKDFDYILLTWFCLNMLQIIYFYVAITSEYLENPMSLLIPGALLQLLNAPVLFIYVSVLVHARPFSIRHYWYHLIPFVGMLMSVYYYHYFDPEIEVVIRKAILFYQGRPPTYMLNYGMTLAAISFAYPLLSLILLFRHRKNIEDQFSYHEEVTLNWLRHWITLEMVGFWISFIVIWFADFEYMDLLSSFKVVASVLVINVFVIGLFGIRQQVIFGAPINLPQRQPDKYAKSKIDVDHSAKIREELERLMTVEEPFLEPKLTIDQLAEKLELSRHQLSQVLNSSMKVNFFDFINKYRVNAFKQRLASDEFNHLSMLGIALDCGFNSKSSFNDVFKKIEGKTPTAYKNQIKRSSPTTLDD